MIGTKRRHAHWAPGDNAPAIPVLSVRAVVVLLRKAQVHTTAGDRWPWANDNEAYLERAARHLRFENWRVRMGRAHEWSPWVERAEDEP